MQIQTIWKTTFSIQFSPIRLLNILMHEVKCYYVNSHYVTCIYRWLKLWTLYRPMINDNMKNTCGLYQQFHFWDAFVLTILANPLYHCCLKYPSSLGFAGVLTMIAFFFIASLVFGSNYLIDNSTMIFWCHNEIGAVCKFCLMQLIRLCRWRWSS